jgi:putative heme-binding domain-containing protein
VVDEILRSRAAIETREDWEATLGKQPFHLLRVLELCAAEAPEAVARQRWKVLSLVLELLPPDDGARRVWPYGDDRRLQRRTALLLGRLISPDIRRLDPGSKFTTGTPADDHAATAIAGLLKSEVQEDRLTGLLALRDVGGNFGRGNDPKLYFETLNAGSRFVGGQGMPTFIAKLREDALASLSEDAKKKLADVINPKPPEPEPLPPPRPVVKKWTLEELASLVGDPSAGGGTTGDAKRGAVVFRDALCSRCHRAGLTGPAVGPDLTMVARRFSRRDMLASIVTPSAAVADIYRNSEITTDDGRSIVGRVIVEGDFRSEKLLVNTDPLRPTQWVEIDKKQIEEHREAKTSPMPEGLLDSFKPQEIADLLAFLESELRER